MMSTRHYHTNPLALALAGVLGAVIGIIFVPKRGEQAHFSKERYGELVSKAIKSYAKGKKWTKETADDLKKHFEEDWGNVKRSLHK